VIVDTIPHQIARIIRGMSFFKKKASIEQRRQERAALQDRLEKARIAVEEARTAATQAALEGVDDKKLDAAEATTRRAIERTWTLETALQELDAEIAALEAKAVADEDRRVREATARDLNARADRGEKLVPLLVEHLTALHRWLLDDVPRVADAACGTNPQPRRQPRAPSISR
jgi:hypothetical protein